MGCSAFVENDISGERSGVPPGCWQTKGKVKIALPLFLCRTLGCDTREEITGHGFRATARTLIRELLGWDREFIERHLAHVSDEELGGSYDRTTFLGQRRLMIQLWANLLDDRMRLGIPS